MKPTISRIAELAGVSKTAVSFAFNDPSKIARSTYERIMEIAEREGYVPDPVARSMTQKRVGAIGVLLPQAIQDTFRNPYVSEVLRGIGSVCHQEDLFLTILPPVKGFLSHAIRTAVVDGFIALGVEASPELATTIRQRHVPFVTIDGDAESGIPNVGIDDVMAAESIMNYVLSLGHRDIIILSLKSEGPGTREEYSSRTVDRRSAGFERALQAYGLSLQSPEIRVYPVDVTMEAAEELLIPILRAKPPTAIVSMSDSAAFGAYLACRKVGLSIPQDITITGMDDVPFASLMDPPLTTVRQPGMRKGAYAVRTVLDLIQGRVVASAILPTELVIRGSSAPPPPYPKQE
ncbi:MAG: LacI family transcriptional regulator [Treponemataceae bacterium]|nr:LacI family transcriptional regulator [Treponemataceae bacterium]